MADSLSTPERRAYDLIVENGGLLQSRLWKELDADSRQGSRLATSLEEKGLIEREPTTNGGQRTYRLTPVEDPSTPDPERETVPRAQPAAAAEEDRLSDREERALALITDRGGLYQSELWKALEVSSRTGSRIATGLEEKGAIRRTETTYDGQRTYFLYPTARDLDFSLLMAGDMISPFVAAEAGGLSIDSDEFTHWLLNLPDEPP